MNQALKENLCDNKKMVEKNERILKKKLKCTTKFKLTGILSMTIEGRLK